MKYFINIFIVISFWFSLLSCETKEYENGDEFNPGLLSTGGGVSSRLKFLGITSVSNVTDSSVTIAWDENNDALEYYIYIIENENPYFFARTIAPSNEFTLKNLDSDTSYQLQVRLVDDLGLLDSNAQTISIKTLEGPSDSLTITRLSPSSINDLSLRPIFLISGLKDREKVTLFSDNCFTEVARGFAKESSLVLTSSELVPDITYQFHVQRESEKGVSSSCSTEFSTYNLMSCPNGYTLVPDGGNRGINEFCVMKFEARAWNDSDGDNFVDLLEVDPDGCEETFCTTKNWGGVIHKPGSSVEGLPWRMIDIQMAQNECKSLGDNYDLISNREWMVLAEDIEANPLNWSGGGVISSTGCVLRGNNGLSDACGYDALGLDGETNLTTRDARQRGASHILSNGNKIWDFSGNVAEWVSWGNEGDLEANSFFCDDLWGEITLDFCKKQIDPLDFLPKNPGNISTSLYTSDRGLGQIEGGSGNVLLRSGSFNYGEYAGIYTASFGNSKSSARSDIGFRCVYRRDKL